MTAPHCPLCRQPLVPEDLEGVTLHCCETDGVWLSHEDYTHMLRRAEAAGKSGQYARVRVAEGDGAALLRHRNRPRRIRARKAADVEPGPEPAPQDERACPVCGTTMAIEERNDIWKHFPKVVVDICPEHGTWLDRGELEALVERAYTDGQRVAGYKVRKAYDEAAATARQRRRDGETATISALFGALGGD